MADFDAARDKILMGAKREEVITEKDKRATAYHEVGPCPGRLADPQGRPGAQGHHHPPRPRPGRDPVPPDGRPRRATNEQRHPGRCSPSLWAAGPPNGSSSTTCRRRRQRPQDGHAARPADGHPVGNERPVGPVFFRDSEEHPFLGREMSEPRDHSEHTAAAHRRRSRPDPARSRRTRLPPARRPPRRARTADRSPDRARSPLRRRNRRVDRQTRHRP